MTNDQCKLIATKLCGYQVQVSPAGKYYIVTDDGTRPLPDFEVDAAETLSTVEALCKSRDWSICLVKGKENYIAGFGGAGARNTTITAAIAACLLQIAEDDSPTNCREEVV
jgi:hypothetical protein